MVAEVKRQLLNDLEFAPLGRTAEERASRLGPRQGDVVECDGGGASHRDLDRHGPQQYANPMLREWLPPSTDLDNPTPTGAIAMVDNKTELPK